MTEEDIKRINEAYTKETIYQDPIDDIASTFKGLVALIFVVAGLTMIAFAFWGK
jgi:hypothetical protein